MLTRYCLLDLETIALPDARTWLGEVTAPANYSKPDSIAAYIRDETERLITRAPLDPDLCSICVVGCQPWNAEGWVRKVLNPQDERDVLTRVWGIVNATCPMVGYGLTWFDAGVLVRRSQFLGVRVPEGFYEQGKYRHPWITELADRVTLNGLIEQKKGRGLDYHCRRLGIEVPDDFTGADVAALWAEGAHDAVAAHCMADLTRIQRLAERLYVIPEVREIDPVLPMLESEAF